MALMLKPDFALKAPNPNPRRITDALWWFKERCDELEPELGEFLGILAWKPGFHSTGQYNLQNFPGNYSIRDSVNRTGPWWRDYSSAFDWGFLDAKARDYSTISKYSNRLRNSGRDPLDPRLDLSLFDFYGQTDNDVEVEGWNEYREENTSSDPSHLWHIHFGFLRSKVGDFWGMWALYTVLIGWTVQQWQSSLNGGGSEDMYLLTLKGNGTVYLVDAHQHRPALDGPTAASWRAMGFPEKEAATQSEFDLLAGDSWMPREEFLESVRQAAEEGARAGAAGATEEEVRKAIGDAMGAAAEAMETD